jgi:hypothetical protein
MKREKNNEGRMCNMKSRIFLFVFLFLFSLPFYAQSAGGAGKTANNAMGSLEEASSGGPAVQTTRGGSRPRWTSSPYSDYPQSR